MRASALAAVLPFVVLTGIFRVQPPAAGPSPAQRAVAAENRLERDLARDETRKPARVLDFFQIRASQRVADIQAGDGYYTELLSTIVGPEGEVIAVNNQFPRRFMGEAFDARIARESFDASNIVQADRELDAMDLPEGQLDRALLIRFYHDFEWQEVDRDQFNRDVFEALKPGGVYCIVDHHAKAGAGITEGKRLHRVEEALVRREVEAAGFVLEAVSYALEDPTDARDFNIFENDAARRDRTDRFMHFYRKPSDAE